ncbi:MAG: sulfatase-like hydrolase/transferase [Lachnospiraceae bacterium]|nr:sulfatase-like hydrolase/transferase [Lachnospiraceae bacterium]
MSENKPMNLVIILSDQHSKRMLGCYGNEKVKTPNLDRLGAEGVCFDNAYCNSPICVPSRAVFATGDYASRNGYWDNAHAYGGEVKSWGGRLQEEGYSVTTIGKLHYKNESPKTGFVDQRIPLNIKNGVGDVYGAIRDKEITRYQFRDALLTAGAGESDYITYDREVAKRAAAYLKTEGTGKEKPFVLYVGFVTPHFPLIVPQEYLDLYPDEEAIRRPVQFEPEEWNHHPVVEDYRRYCGTEQVSREQAIHAIRTYYGLCSFMDEQVGVVMDALRDSGLDVCTRVLYSADHGDTMGDHGVYFKSTMYEGSVGIPMMMKGPDIPAGERRDTIVSLADVYPTVLENVGVEASEEDRRLPGSSLLAYAKGKKEERTAFSEYYSQGIYTAMFMLRKGPYKYVHYVGERPQLFDLEKDPLEQQDLAEGPEYEEALSRLYEELKEIADVEALEEESKAAQRRLLDAHGGREEFLRNFKPTLFSPIPNLD